MRIAVETPDGDLEGIVGDDTDLDGQFIMHDELMDERVKVNGWACSITIV